MIYARYSEKPEEIELVGDHEGLTGLACLLACGRGSMDVLVPDTSVAPYDGFASHINVEHDDGFVLISRRVTTLNIRGSIENLAALARSIVPAEERSQELPSGPIDYHFHIEYYPGHSFLDSNSTPLIVFPVG